MNTFKRIGFGIATATAIAFMSTSVHATLTLSPGLVGGSGDVDNVVFNACGPNFATQVGIQIQGCLNTSPSTLVNFTGQETLKSVEAGGQARIEAEDGAFQYVQIQLADASLGFSKLQFNLDAIADGFASFQAVDQFGAVFNFDNIALDGQGNNFFTLGSLDGQVAVSFTLTTTVAIQNITELQQVRLGATEAGVCPNGAPNFPLCSPQVETPEPMSMAVLGIGLAGLGAARMRRRSA